MNDFPSLIAERQRLAQVPARLEYPKFVYRDAADKEGTLVQTEDEERELIASWGHEIAASEAIETEGAPVSSVNLLSESTPPKRRGRPPRTAAPAEQD